MKAQVQTPILIGQPSILAPAIDSSGGNVLFGSSIQPSFSSSDTVDLYLSRSGNGALERKTVGVTGISAVAITPNGLRAAYVSVNSSANPGGEEVVHLLDTDMAVDRTLAVDTQGCLQPLCIGCLSSCLRTPHISPDGGKVLYAASRDQPFYTVNSDGTGLARLPVFSGTLAPSPQRVISRNGLVVFISSAVASRAAMAAPPNVYTMNLDGSNIRAVTSFTSTNISLQNATISAGGGTIVFETNYDPNSSTPAKSDQIWLVRGDGSGLRALTSGPGATGPSLSADGSLVTFLQSGQVYMVRADGKSLPVPLTRFQSAAAYDAVLSDDGSRVAFVAGPPNGGRGAIDVLKADGSDLQNLFAPSLVNANGIVSTTGGALSAGSLATIYGTNIGPDGLTTAKGFPLPTTLGGVSVLLNGAAVPLLAVTPWQVNLQIPPGTPEGAANFQVKFANAAISPPATADIKAIAPALFTYVAAGSEPNSVYFATAAFHAGTGVPADAAHPAATGETLEFYGTGFGPTNPPVAAGEAAPANPPAQTIFRPQLSIQFRPATVTFSGLVPGLVGVYQINAIIPNGMPAGLHPVSFGTAVMGSIALK